MSGAIQTSEEGRWLVQSDSGPRKYVVTLKTGKWRCSCPAWTQRSPRKDCKHIRRKRKQVVTKQSGFVPPDTAAVFKRLKDFQRSTADYVFRRLYGDEDPVRYFLVADEVGLGKTLVARGVIAKVMEHFKKRSRRLNVVYICSNAEIAAQNVNRLNVTGEQEFEFATRITMLPLIVDNLEKNQYNFVSFTPGTSFELQESFGLAKERALIHHMLERAWALKRADAVALLKGRAGLEGFKQRIAEYDAAELDETLVREFARELATRCAEQRRAGSPDLKSRFRRLCREIGRNNGKLSSEIEQERESLVGEIRLLLAASNLRTLKPDLVILDEFQRFKHLLHGDSPGAILASRLFNYTDDVRTARVLLLSATPYKMLTLSGEEVDGDHHKDFIETLEKILFKRDPTAMERVRALLDRYRTEVFRVHEDGFDAVRTVRSALERELRRVMVRTEKLGVDEARGEMLRHVALPTPRLDEKEVGSYRAYHGIARALHQAEPIEYWKSAPYLFNFMDAYVLKERFRHSAADPAVASQLRRGAEAGLPVLLPWETVKVYGEIDPANARLRALADGTVGTGAWKLLWIAPSMPYYRLSGPYGDEGLARFTKRLVFSCWKVVPKVIATLLSYAAERQAVLASERSPSYDPEARRRRGGLLRFTRDQGRPSGMPLFVLLYPGVVLAKTCDPWTMLRTNMGATPTAAAALEATRTKVLAELGRLPLNAGPGSRPDENWYWAAPLLMDAQLSAEAGGRWLGRSDLEDLWYAQEGKHLEQEDDPAWIDHLRLARQLVAGEVKLGPQPKDLPDVLARMALSAPGVCALRALCRVTGGPDHAADHEIRDYAFQMAWSFRSLFNQPDVTSLVRGLKPGEPYWQRVLEYCVDGCLQAVLDEYAHILREACGLLDSPPYEIAEALSAAVRRALSLRSVVLRGDAVRLTARDVRIEQGQGLRCRFALRYGDERTDEEGELTRSEVVREAFNSPFWPFVLATTSIGQEGLDFHQYCHAVVHWNLPRNPVDFEQREGRVHRYKGLAVRRNLAMHYGPKAGNLSGNDPWEAMFAQAVRDRPRAANDLIPFWVYPLDGGAFIERHVPALPLSRDLDQLARLRRSLAVYRMVFGQPSQEDLIAYLLERLPEPALKKVIAEARIDLSPTSS